MIEVWGIPLSEWRELQWWPEGHEAQILPGIAGHESEVCVNIDGYSYSVGDEPIPAQVFDVFKALLPDSWKVDNRGSRFEVHPSGRYNGGYDDLDIQAINSALRQMGLVVV